MVDTWIQHNIQGYITPWYRTLNLPSLRALEHSVCPTISLLSKMISYDCYLLYTYEFSGKSYHTQCPENHSSAWYFVLPTWNQNHSRVSEHTCHCHETRNCQSEWSCNTRSEMDIVPERSMTAAIYFWILILTRNGVLMEYWACPTLVDHFWIYLESQQPENSSTDLSWSPSYKMIRFPTHRERISKKWGSTESKEKKADKKTDSW